MSFFRLSVWFIIFLFTATGVSGQEIVFLGVPIVKNSSSHEKTANQSIEDKDQAAYKLVIAKEGGKYYWLSREKKPLEYKKSGSFHYFYDPQGVSYIKILPAEEGKYLYLEHISLGFNTVSYWGGGSKLEP